MSSPLSSRARPSGRQLANSSRHNIKSTPQASHGASSRRRDDGISMISRRNQHLYATVTELTNAPYEQRHECLQALLAEKQDQLEALGMIGKQFIEQQQELERAVARLEQLGEADVDDENDPRQANSSKERDDLERGLRELQKVLQTYHQDNQPLLSQLTQKDEKISLDSPNRTHRNMDPFLDDNAQGLKTPSGPNAAVDLNSPMDLATSRHVNQSFVLEVRRLQALLHERDKALKAATSSKAELEAQLQPLLTAKQTMDEALERLREDNWTLEINLQDSRAALQDAQNSLVKSDAEQKRMAKVLSTTRETAEGHKTEAERLANEIEELKVRHETEMARARTRTAGLERDKSDLQSQLMTMKPRSQHRLLDGGSPGNTPSPGMLSPAHATTRSLRSQSPADDEDVFGANSKRTRGPGFDANGTVLSPSDLYASDFDSPQTTSDKRDESPLAEHDLNEMDDLRNALGDAEREIAELRARLGEPVEPTMMQASPSSYTDSPLGKAGAARGRVVSRGVRGRRGRGATRGNQLLRHIASRSDASASPSSFDQSLMSTPAKGSPLGRAFSPEPESPTEEHESLEGNLGAELGDQSVHQPVYVDSGTMTEAEPAQDIGRTAQWVQYNAKPQRDLASPQTDMQTPTNAQFPARPSGTRYVVRRSGEFTSTETETDAEFEDAQSVATMTPSVSVNAFGYSSTSDAEFHSLAPESSVDEDSDQESVRPFHSQRFGTVQRDDTLRIIAQPQPEIHEIVREVPIEVIREVFIDRPVDIVREVTVEKLVEVEKIVDRPVEVIKEVLVEKPIEVIKHVEVIREMQVDRPVEVIREVERIVEVPFEIIKHVDVVREVQVDRPVEIIREVERIVEVPVEVIKHVDVIREVQVDRPVEILRDVERIVEVPVEKIVERTIETVKEVFVDRPIEVVKEVEKIVDRPVEVIKEVERIVDRPIEIIKEVFIDRPVEIVKEVFVDREVEKLVDRHIEVEVEKIVHRDVHVDRVVEIVKHIERVVDRPVEVIKEVVIDRPVEIIKEVEVIVHRDVPVDRPVEVIKEVERRIEVPIYQEVVVHRDIFVDRPVHTTLEVEKRVEMPVEVIKHVEVPVEVPVEVIKHVEVPVEVIKHVEVPVEVPVEVIKHVEVPVEVIKHVEVPVEVIKHVEVPVEVIKHVEVPVEVIKEVEIIKHVEVPVEVIKHVEVPVEIVKQVEVPVIQHVEVIRETFVDVPRETEIVREVPIERQVLVDIPRSVEIIHEVPVDREIIREVPVDREVIREVFIDREVIREVPVDREVIREVPVDREIFVDREVVREVMVPVEVVREVFIERAVPASTSSGTQTEPLPAVPNDVTAPVPDIGLFRVQPGQTFDFLRSPPSPAMLSKRGSRQSVKQVATGDARGLARSMPDSDASEDDEAQLPIVNLPPPPSVPPPAERKPARPMSPPPSSFSRVTTPVHNSRQMPPPSMPRQRSANSFAPAAISIDSFGGPVGSDTRYYPVSTASVRRAAPDSSTKRRAESVFTQSAASSAANTPFRPAPARTNSVASSSAPSSEMIAQTPGPNVQPDFSLPGLAGSHLSSEDVHALTRCMIGDFFWKNTRKTFGSGISASKHRRYFWVNVYTRTLLWSAVDQAGLDSAESNAKSAFIEGMRVVDNSGEDCAWHKSIMISAKNREIRMTAESEEQHNTWVQTLSFLVGRPSQATMSGSVSIIPTSVLTTPVRRDYRLPESEYESERDDRGRLDDFARTRSVKSTKTWSRALSDHSQTPRGPRSQSAMSIHSQTSAYPTSMSKRRGTAAHEYLALLEKQKQQRSTSGMGRIQSGIEADFEGLENVRACCDGKHDVGSLEHQHHTSLVRPSSRASSSTRTPLTRRQSDALIPSLPEIPHPANDPMSPSAASAFSFRSRRSYGRSTMPRAEAEHPRSATSMSAPLHRDQYDSTSTPRLDGRGSVGGVKKRTKRPALDIGANFK